MSTQTQSDTETKKYVILKSSAHWDPQVEGTNFILSHTQPECKPHARYHSKLKKELRDKIARAVRLQVLDFTDSPDTYKEDELKEKTSSEKEVRFYSDELKRKDVQANRSIPKAPQIGNNTMKIQGVSPEAAKFMQLQSQLILDRLPAKVANMKTNTREQFLRDVLKVENKGLNPAMSPRREIVDAIEDEMVNAGYKVAAMSDITSEVDKDSDDSVLRIHP